MNDLLAATLFSAVTLAVLVVLALKASGVPAIVLWVLAVVTACYLVHVLVVQVVWAAMLFLLRDYF